MTTSPDLDALCSQHFRYRDLIECGDTWHRLAEAHKKDLSNAFVSNLPTQDATWRAIEELCTKILDPVVEHFGPITLTYGLAGPSLTRHIPLHIAPKLDQHASCELNSRGNIVCARKGLAVDFGIKGLSSRAVSLWIIDNLPFDRLYFYGDDRPLHVSFGHENNRQIVEMLRRGGDRRVPRVLKDRHALAERGVFRG